jgi:hypothetical protein
MIHLQLLARAAHMPPMRTGRFLLLPLVLVGCVHATTLRPAPYISSHRNLPARPGVVAVIDSALSSLGLPSLAATSLPPTYREFRISRGQGLVLGGEYPLVRIVASPSEVVGEVIHFRAVLSGSGDTVRIVRWAARVERPTALIDWPRVVMLLYASGVADLDPPKYTTAYMDAGDLVVEVLRGPSYRAYELNAPQLRTDSIGHHAARIATLVDSLDRLTRDGR